jgi:hypothetical protein
METSETSPRSALTMALQRMQSIELEDSNCEEKRIWNTCIAFIKHGRTPTIYAKIIELMRSHFYDQACVLEYALKHGTIEHAINKLFFNIDIPRSDAMSASSAPIAITHRRTKPRGSPLQESNTNVGTPILTDDVFELSL